MPILPFGVEAVQDCLRSFQLDCVHFLFGIYTIEAKFFAAAKLLVVSHREESTRFEWTERL